MLRVDPRALRWLRLRLAILGVATTSGLVLLAVRAYRLQIEETQRLRDLGRKQYSEKVEIPAERGAILDRNGNELAVSLSTDSVAASPRDVDDPLATAHRLAAVLGLDERELAARLASDRYFTWIARRVTPEQARAVDALGLPGISLVPEPRRYYPDRDLAGTVLGFVGTDGAGLAGLEQSDDAWLRGSTASASGLRDALGHVMLTAMPDLAPTTGHTVVTTLDATIQFAAERALAAAVTQTHARSATLVALDPATGEVLAMASVPNANPNAPGAAPADARPRAVTDAFEPGSTMKVFTVSAALDAGVVRPDEWFDVEGGSYPIGAHVIHDDEPHDALTVAGIIQHSSNIGAAKIARRLGRDALGRAFTAFGFGRPTHVGLPGESAGVVHPPARWGDFELATVAFGQGISVTAVQLVAGLAAIADGGVYHAPHLLARVTDEDGGVVYAPPVETRRVVAAATAAAMDAMLRTVVEKGGTAEGITLPGYPIAGKTGTAQRVDPATGRYSPDLWTSSFMGYVPADHPRLVMIVVIDEPQGGHLGGKVAAPVFRDVAEAALRYLGVPPETPPPVVAASLPAAPADDTLATVAPLTALDDATSLPVVGAGATVPDFTGMSIPEALRAADAAHLELRVVGTGRASEQTPGPGAAPTGTVCRVEFLPPG